MKKIAKSLLLIPFGIALSGCVLCTQGSGNIVTEAFDLDSFHSIDLRGEGNIYLTQANENALSIETDDNILENLEVYVENGTLIIKPEKTIGCLDPTKNINIYATMEDIESFDLSGSGAIIGETLIEADKLDIEVSGSGDIDLEVDVTTLSIDISGSGEANLEGRAINNNFEVSGSGTLNAIDLESDTVDIDISGSGEAHVTAIDSLEVEISGSGDVRYKGDPEISQSVSGSGNIQRAE